VNRIFRTVALCLVALCTADLASEWATSGDGLLMSDAQARGRRVVVHRPVRHHVVRRPVAPLPGAPRRVVRRTARRVARRSGVFASTLPGKCVYGLYYERYYYRCGAYY
jgi:hypothetical protein